MAKIYEQRDDILRERISHQASEQRKRQSEQTTAGILSIALGLSSLRIGKLEKFEADVVGKKPSFISKLNRPIGWAFNALGAVELLGALSNRNKAREAEKWVEKLGPAEVLLPDDMQPGDALPLTGAGVTEFRMRRFAHGPKSLLEHAEHGCEAPEQAR